jgi:hypothetical protein
VTPEGTAGRITGFITQRLAWSAAIAIEQRTKAATKTLVPQAFLPVFRNTGKNACGTERKRAGMRMLQCLIVVSGG